MSKTITTDQLSQLACKYGLTLADLQTIREVEAAGKGFLPDGRPKILFERHKFSDFTGGVFNASHSDISNHKPGGYSSGAGEWKRFDKAVKLADGKYRDQAIMATSWGAGQVMGFHWKDLGYANPQAFLMANWENEAGQMEVMLKFITMPKNARMLKALKDKDWPTFAYLYNGPKYKINDYDTKLAAAYRKHAGATV